MYLVVLNELQLVDIVIEVDMLVQDESNRQKKRSKAGCHKIVLYTEV